MNLQDVPDAFNIQASHEQLSGGSQPTFKVGNFVLKRVKEPSLENNHSPELIQWIAEFSQTLKQDGFRFPKALQTKDGKWITPDGWTARDRNTHLNKWRNVHFTASKSAAMSAGRPPGGVLRRVSRAQVRLHSPG